MGAWSRAETKRWDTAGNVGSSSWGVAFEGFIHGHLIGREEERQRTRQFFHDILSSKLLVASFTAHEIYQSLVEKGAQEAEEQARVTKLLRELIDDICHTFADPDIRPEPIPKSEAASLDRLLGS